MLMLGLLAVAACTQRAKVPEPVEGPTTELCAIDSLMWRQPDSALTCLLPCFDTCIDTKFCVSTATAYNRHYAHLLLSELLYKNDYAQVNRTELLQAVAFFDSITQVPEPAVAEHGRRVEGPSKEQNVFLSARAHYINGVGYYENDSVVEACAEYLKTLEVMEEHFEDKDLVGHKARFMAYTYNRLGDMFSEQFMMEPAIDCYQNALVFCKIEPTSPQGISNILYRLGKQYDKMGEKTKASDYYEQAIHGLPNNNSLLFRDLVSTKALCDYQLGRWYEQSLNTLKQIQTQANSEIEYLLRSLTIGGIFFKKMMFDSALFYLVPVYENKENVTIQIQAADYLRIIYDSLDNKEKSDECVRFLANQTKAESQNKALVSQLDNLFQSHISQKQEKKAAQEKRDAVLRTVKVLVPIAFLMAVIVIMIIRRRNKRKLADQDAEAQQKLETESKRHEEAMEAAHRAHRMEQAAISGRLKRSNERLRDVSKQLEETLAKNTSFEPETIDDYTAFVNAPVCLYIVRLVHTQQFKSKMDYLIYKDDALSKEQLLALHDAAETNLPRFVSLIRKQFPKLTDNDMDYCYLFLLGLNEADISALMQRAYTTVCDRSRKINRIIGANESLYHTLRNMLSE
jgi:tetratricopeptide (TPR) repeat protein